MKNFNYHDKRTQLDEIMAWFESGDVDIDQAITKYKKAEQLLIEIEDYLSDTKAKIELLVKQSGSKK